jgi:hypothetical protein
MQTNRKDHWSLLWKNSTLKFYNTEDTEKFIDTTYTVGRYVNWYKHQRKTVWRSSKL